MAVKKLRAIRIIRGTEKQEIRHLGAMMEIMNDNILILAKGHEELRNEVRDMRVTLDAHTEMIGQLMIDIVAVKEETRHTDKRIAALERSR